jgi:hypothetical protein
LRNLTTSALFFVRVGDSRFSFSRFFSSYLSAALHIPTIADTAGVQSFIGQYYKEGAHQLKPSSRMAEHAGSIFVMRASTRHYTWQCSMDTRIWWSYY